MIYMVYNDKYVAAIVEGTGALKEFLSNVPYGRVDKFDLKVEALHGAAYPLRLIEVDTGSKRMFVYVEHYPYAERDLRNTILQSRMKILTTYTIKADFFGNTNDPGADHMSVLDHDHEDEE